MTAEQFEATVPGTLVVCIGAFTKLEGLCEIVYVNGHYAGIKRL
jgi:hypothetical protein